MDFLGCARALCQARARALPAPRAPLPRCRRLDARARRADTRR